MEMALVIRKQQMEAFQPVAEAAFVRKVADYLRETHAEVKVRLPGGDLTVRQIPDETLLEMAQNGIARARGYGITWKSTLKAFVVLMFVAAPNFDEHPLVSRVLQNDEFAPDSRIDRLWERISEHNWDAVKQNYDPAAWRLKSGEN
jgi:hypothetical protein